MKQSSSKMNYEILKGLGVDEEPVAEHQFLQTRRWRFDYAWPNVRLAVELEGGIWLYGRHNHPGSMVKDMEKYNAAAESRWYLLRYEPRRIDYEQIARVFRLLKFGENIR